MSHSWRWRVIFKDKDGHEVDYWTDEKADADEIACRRDGQVVGPFKDES